MGRDCHKDLFKKPPKRVLHIIWVPNPAHHDYDNIIIVVIIFCPLDDIFETHILLGAVYKLLTTRFPLGDTVPGNDLLIIIIIFAKFKSAYSTTQCLLMIELIFEGLLTCSFPERSQNDRWHNVGRLPDYYRTCSRTFENTRPKPAYGRQGLDWIVGPGYSFVVFSTNRGI